MLKALFSVLVLHFIGFLGMVEAGQKILTLSVPSSQVRCFSDFLSTKSTHVVKYHVLKSQKSSQPLVVEDPTSPEDAGFRVYIQNSSKTGDMFSSSTVTNRTTLKASHELMTYTFCLQSYSEEELKVRFNISTGLDINDFGELPLQETQETIGKSLSIVEDLVSEMASTEVYRKHELQLMDHSDRIFSQLLSYTGVAIGFFFVAGCAQTLFLNKKLLTKKLE